MNRYALQPEPTIALNSNFWRSARCPHLKRLGPFLVGHRERFELLTTAMPNQSSGLAPPFRLFVGDNDRFHFGGYESCRYKVSRVTVRTAKACLPPQNTQHSLISVRRSVWGPRGLQIVFCGASSKEPPDPWHRHRLRLRLVLSYQIRHPSRV